MTPTATRTLSTADERRETVLSTAMEAFADRGYYGTPTTEVARRAGISQAYLFRLYPTKEELFVAVVDRCHERILETFRTAAAGAEGRSPEELAGAMGRAYGELLQDRSLLLVQLHAQSACSEAVVRDAVRRGFARLVDYVAAVTGADEEAIQRFFAVGMLCNVVAAMGADEVDAPWARMLVKDLSGHERGT
jgi:AcrR family transcriptional regulator